jgi:hypothetical protein
MRKQLLACALLAITTTASADDKKYTLADLKALVSQKSFKEAVAHLGDIAPTERNADWQALAADAATGYVTGLSNDDYGAKIGAIEQLDEAFPMILKSPKYTKVRAEIGLTGFAKCFGQDSGYWWRSNASFEVCRDHLVKFVDADAGNPDLTLRAAKLFRREVSPHSAAAGFFKKAITAAGKNAGAVCKDEDLKLVVVSGFNAPKDWDQNKIVHDIVVNTCWNEFKSVVLDEYKKAGETSSERRNTCAILKAKSSLSADQTRACEKAKKDD